jgi:hypothetical protein
VPSQALFQQATPPDLMGRVGSTFMSIVFAADRWPRPQRRSDGLHQCPTDLRPLRRRCASTRSNWQTVDGTEARQNRRLSQSVPYPE